MSLPLQQIGAIDPRRLDPDEHFSRTRPGNRPGGEPKHFRSARLCDLDIAHGFGCRCHVLSRLLKDQHRRSRCEKTLPKTLQK